MLEPGLARGRDQLREERAADALSARLRANVDVAHVRRLTATLAEHAEDEPERTAVLLRDQRDTLGNRHGQVLPGLVPGFAQVRLVVELGLELLPQLAQQIVIGLGGDSNRHR